ncbi:hypothetical protein Sjap_006495 [Stephania japonica]|uniref:Uncharacterized protein n=1 Tax=Stephania japonica TaxID=461633 RepID=A0AAP0K5Z8_9MAGN
MNANLKLIFGIPKLYQVVENLWGHALEFQSDTESRIDRFMSNINETSTALLLCFSTAFSFLMLTLIQLLSP